MKLSLFSNCHDLDPYTYKNPKHWGPKVFTGMSKKIDLCEQNVGYLILGNLNILYPIVPDIRQIVSRCIPSIKL